MIGANACSEHKLKLLGLFESLPGHVAGVEGRGDEDVRLRQQLLDLCSAMTGAQSSTALISNTVLSMQQSRHMLGPQGCGLPSGGQCYQPDWGPSLSAVVMYVYFFSSRKDRKPNPFSTQLRSFAHAHTVGPLPRWPRNLRIYQILHMMMSRTVLHAELQFSPRHIAMRPTALAPCW